MSGITRRTACSVCGVGKPDDGWAYWKGGLPYCHECYKSTFRGIEVNMQTVCCVCGTDDDDQGWGAWNNKYYCSKCFCSTFGVNKLGTLVTSKEIACKGCGKLTLTSSYKREGWQILNDHYYCSDCATVSQPETTTTMKSSNPKDLAAVTRVPMHLWPMTATVHGCSAIYEGMRKYGYYNWRHDKVSIMTYVAALQRHLFRYVGGQWADKNSGATHLGHILACLAILVDAHESGRIIDDRPIAGPDVERLMGQMEKVIEGMAERHKDKHPVHHYRGTEGKQ